MPSEGLIQYNKDWNEIAQLLGTLNVASEGLIQYNKDWNFNAPRRSVLE